MAELTGINVGQLGICGDAEHVDSVAIVSCQHRPKKSVRSLTHLFSSQHTASGFKRCLNYCSSAGTVNIPHIYERLPYFPLPATHAAAVIDSGTYSLCHSCYFPLKQSWYMAESVPFVKMS
jgi:hypothetical protein